MNLSVYLIILMRFGMITFLCCRLTSKLKPYFGPTVLKKREEEQATAKAVFNRVLEAAGRRAWGEALFWR